MAGRTRRVVGSPATSALRFHGGPGLAPERREGGRGKPRIPPRSPEPSACESETRHMVWVRPQATLS
ncbi:hypothetical protein NKR19_g4853 [Coniochaeta hoffmannii]|uniref:Uncharacterized protein n=1 Tax=Coniochaeta hoffmannii TaxID=91930 RepID=A0AA38S071_9PEZI|nr:hypothetical protein NKR19_g4853 [Coniochaeta hoffmannii]